MKILQFETSKFESGPGEELLSAFEWVVNTIRDTPFGEVGVTFVLHNGKVTRIKRLIESS